MLRSQLLDLYVGRRLSVTQIAQKEKCSQNKINYWLAKHQIKKRSISEAVYQHYHPLGDPFRYRKPVTLEQGILFGLGLGIYWGEGLKRGKGGVRLANTDVRLVKKFITFLERNFGVKKEALNFGLQIFNDISSRRALRYWTRELEIKKSQFYKVIVSKVRGEGTYKYKSEYGVIMVYFNNVKLKALICNLIETIL